MKKLILCMLVMILLVGTVSAWEFDNYKNYNEETKTITVRNGFTFGTPIAEIQLKTPLVYQVGYGAYAKVAEFEVTSFKDYNNAFKELELFDKRNGDKKFVRDYNFKVLSYKDVEVNDYGQVYIGKSSNGSAIWKQGIVGTHTEQREVWTELALADFKKDDVVTIGIFTFVEKGDHVEWIPNLFGVRVEEWAVWTSSLNANLKAYYKFDEGTGNETTDSLSLVRNGTSSNASAWATGIIGNSISFDGVDDYVNMTNMTGLLGNTNVSVSFWIYPRVNMTTAQYIWDGFPSSARNYQKIQTNWDMRMGGITDLFNPTIAYSDIVNFSLNNWHHIVLVYNSAGNDTFYWDGNNIKNNNTVWTPADTKWMLLGIASNYATPLQGRIDEMGFWDRALSGAEVTDLYNGSSGITYTVLGPEVTLNSPANAFQTTNRTIEFNGTATSPEGIVNVSLFLNGVLNETNSSGINATDYLFTKTFVASSHNWTYESCNVNGCQTASARTFTIADFIENTVTFNAGVLETSSQSFELNITTISSILSIDAFLIYNGTRDVSTTSCSDVNCTLTNTIDIPLTATESENKSFFWEITAFDGTTSVTINTTANKQNVSMIHIEECDATYTIQALNFTAYDEQNLTRVSPYKFDATFSQWLSSMGSIKRNNNFTDSSTIEKSLCIFPGDESYFIDAQIEYDEVGEGTLYTSRNYFFQNDTITNSTQNFSLYLLPSASSTSFILKVQDDNLLPLEDYIIETQRYYPGEDVFKTVQISRTGTDGKTIGFFETETVDYRFIIKYNGRTLLTTVQQKIVGEVVPYTITFTIGEDLGKPWEELEPQDDLTFSLEFDKQTNIVTYTYLDTSGDFTLGSLVVEKQNLSFATNTILCNKDSSQSSATMTCNLSTNSTGTYLARGYITRDTELLISQINFIIEDFLETVGMLGVLLAWFLILISSFAFKFNEIAGIFMVNATIIFVNIIGLVSFGMLAISAIVAVSIIIVVVMEK